MVLSKPLWIIHLPLCKMKNRSQLYHTACIEPSETLPTVYFSSLDEFHYVHARRAVTCWQYGLIYICIMSGVQFHKLCSRQHRPVRVNWKVVIATLRDIDADFKRPALQQRGQRWTVIMWDTFVMCVGAQIVPEEINSRKLSIATSEISSCEDLESILRGPPRWLNS